MVTLASTVISDAAVVAEAEVGVLIIQTVAVTVAIQAEVVADVPPLLAMAMGVREEMELEERYEYGPGNSEHCRTERPGCPEA
jgi:hypothetical protein